MHAQTRLDRPNERLNERTQFRIRYIYLNSGYGGGVGGTGAGGVTMYHRYIYIYLFNKHISFIWRVCAQCVSVCVCYLFFFFGLKLKTGFFSSISLSGERANNLLNDVCISFHHYTGLFMPLPRISLILHTLTTHRYSFL